MQLTRRLALLGCAAVPTVGLAAAAKAEAVTNPDAALIALAAEIAVLDDESLRLADEMDDLPWPEQHRIREQQQSPLADRLHEMRDQFVTIPATTIEGFRAKARVLRRWSNCTPGFANPWDDDAIAWSLANDLLGVPSVWRPDEEEDVA
jgi:hypothetical protein